jgi:signal transduction histidine kinase
VKEQDKKVIKHLNRIDEQVGRCDSIVNDLLEYTRGRRVDAVEAAINPWLDQLLDQILEFEKIKMSKHLSQELPPVSYDQEKLRRVVINVVDNAIQAVKAKEQEWRNKVTAYHPEIQVATRAGGGGVIMEISDNGIGMDEKTMDRAFEPLFTTRARGTGLGLANVRKIITEHGGSVSVESNPDLGTKVIIILPKKI